MFDRVNRQINQRLRVKSEWWTAQRPRASPGQRHRLIELEKKAESSALSVASLFDIYSLKWIYVILMLIFYLLVSHPIVTIFQFELFIRY